MRIQKRLAHRGRLDARVQWEIDEAIRNIALRSECSVALVENTLLGDALGISLEERYDEDDKRTISKQARRIKSADKRNKRSAKVIQLRRRA